MAPESSQGPSTPFIWWLQLDDFQPSRRRDLCLTILLPARQLLTRSIQYDHSRQAAGAWEVLDPDFRYLGVSEISKWLRPELVILVRFADDSMNAIFP